MYFFSILISGFRFSSAAGGRAAAAVVRLLFGFGLVLYSWFDIFYMFLMFEFLTINVYLRFYILFID